jgi:L-lysine 2,3-aminomutase
VVVVIHANHTNELDDEVAAAMGRLKSTGATLLNQSVLLAGVNDDASTQIDLSKRLLAIGVLPYYLHQLDQVIGTSHFEVPVSRGLEIIATMRAALPGFAVPRYVQEIPGQPNKTVLA